MRLRIHQNVRAHSRLLHDGLALVAVIVGGEARAVRGAIRSREVVRDLSRELALKRGLVAVQGDIIGQRRVIACARPAITDPRSSYVGGPLGSLPSLPFLGSVRRSWIGGVLTPRRIVIFVEVWVVIVHGWSAVKPIVPSGLGSRVA